MAKIQALRGMQDLLPARKALFRHVEDVARRVFDSYGYQELSMPLLESTNLFKRAVGEATDIVEKEMYTFDDRNGDSITLRPEGTASCIRVAEQHGLLHNQVQRLWYAGPMFRYERPQKGRYRQFEQLGVECFGMSGPDIDLEIILLGARLWKALGLDADIHLELNSLGDVEARAKYREALVDYLNSVKADLDEDSQRRIETNPLRVLDSKAPNTRQLLASAPKLLEYLDDDSRRHFDVLCDGLTAQGIEFDVNPFIVRGLDYYNRTVFEWTTTTLGAQGTVCGGGRYDGLVEQIGGKPTPGVGFALGLDRLALMLEDRFEQPAQADVYIASIGEQARREALKVAEAVRDAFPQLRTLVHCGDGKFKAQLKKADASGAMVSLVLGEDEVAAQTVGVKHLREQTEQVVVSRADLTRHLNQVFGKE